jgi:hypothetical protein
MDSRFRRDLRFLIWVGSALALVILGAGVVGLRGAYWEMAPGAARELAIVAGVGVAVLALAGAWAGWIVRRVKAGRADRPGPGCGDRLTPPAG